MTGARIRSTVPLREQLEELEAEYNRRDKDYPLLVIDGHMRQSTAEARQERLCAAIHTLAWLADHGDMLREYVTYATRVLPPAQGGTWNPPVETDEPEASDDFA
jgi:hypothetical protein